MPIAELSYPDSLAI